MTLRRWSGIVVALLTLHLTLVGADVTCSLHGHGSARSSDHSSMSETQHQASLRVGESATSDQPCEVPTQPDCCRAVTSCAISVALDQLDRAAPAPAMRDVIASAITRTPASLVNPPDPPPPKA